MIRLAANALSLPVDIPWKRLCVSEDMIDSKVCDRRFPARWRSSVAVFGYEPPEEYQEYEGMTVSYLKVVYTITGFQPDPEEVGLKDRRIDSYWSDPAVIEDFKETVSKYYGCYGAILEVAVAPGGTPEEAAKFSLSQYPYFADFEPKKREIYELVSETGEVMSRSLDQVNVRRGTTTTEGHEVLDVFGGFSMSGEGKGPQGGGGGSFGMQGQWGTKDMTQQEYQNIRTTDQAREIRESYSHTTQLTQMYHQFSSYHLGTNRAVFFMLPRPHIVQSESTFVNGPRLLEGIQEVFLVVLRPREIKEICVEAYLETAHIVNQPIHEYETSTGTLTLRVYKQAVDTSGSFGDDSNVTYAEGSETYTPPDGWEVDIERSGGYKIESVSGERIEGYRVTSVGRDHVTVWGKVRAEFHDRTWPESNLLLHGRLEVVVTVYIRRKAPKVVGYDQTLWLTGRGVCCCPRQRPELKPGTVIWEIPFNPGIRKALPIGEVAAMTIAEANQVRARIGYELARSINHPGRYPRGQVGFVDAQFVARRIANLVRTGPSAHPDNTPVLQLPGLDAKLKEKVQAVAPRISRGRLLEMSIQETQDRFGLQQEEALQLRRTALGLVGPPPDPKHRWDPPLTHLPESSGLPDVVGLPLETAVQRLKAGGFTVGEIREADDARPTGTVLNQFPDAGVQAPRGTPVNLVTATGATVQIPDLAGLPLSEALLKLRAAGLRSEPKVALTPSSSEPQGTVVEVTPEPRTYVTPHATVVLQVSSGGPSGKPESTPSR